MTSERDFDRLARAWLELGPNEAPDRAIDAVLLSVESAPQARRPLVWFDWRSIPMTRLTGAAIAVALIAVIGMVAVWRGGDQSVATAPTASPTTTATPVPSASGATVLPSGLEGTWMGGPKPELPLVEGAGSTLQIDPSSVVITQSASAGTAALIASPTFTADGGLEVATAAAGRAGCAATDTGAYTWSLSGSGRQLTIAAVSDPCAARLASLPGTYLRMGCKDPTDNCLGELDAGTYATQFIRPRLKDSSQWEPRYGEVTYTVPDGWANASDWPTDMSLVPVETYASYGPDGGADWDYHEIDVWANPAMAMQTRDCVGTEDPSAEHSVAGFVAWLQAQDRFAVSQPTDLTVGGHPATWVDLAVAPDWQGTCPDLPADARVAQLLTHRGADRSGEEISIRAPERQRLVLVDLGQGDIVAIVVDSSDPTTFDALTSEAMPIIESMTFE